MSNMKCYRCYSKKHYLCFWLTTILLFTLYNECYIYFLKTYGWVEPKCKIPDNCTKILLVSSPKIKAKPESYKHFFSYLSLLESDRHLKNTYFWAHSFAKPDIIIFFGDLMKKNSITTNAQFYDYVNRIFDIFLDQSRSAIKTIWLPSQNDLNGGEENQAVAKVQQFHRSLIERKIVFHKNITYAKIRKIVENIPKFIKKYKFYDTSKILIGLSDSPLILKPSFFAKHVFKKLSPQVLFTAHKKKSIILSADAIYVKNHYSIQVLPTNKKLYKFTLGKTNMYEFIVPKCSYRMDSKNNGYGFAVIVIETETVDLTMASREKLVVPPGLEYLTTIDKLLVHRKIELWEAHSRCKKQNRYVIKNSQGQNIYYADKNTSCLTKCCGSLRPFEMSIFDDEENEVIHLSRPLGCTYCCFPCCLQSVEVSAPPGTVVGTVEQEWSIFCPTFIAKNENGERILKINGPFCSMNTCSYLKFKITSINNGSKIGKIFKQPSVLAEEDFTDADKFGIIFPLDMDVKMKAVILGACMLLISTGFTN